MIKTEDIEKYSNIVKEKYPSSTTRRPTPQKIIWINNGVRVAELEESPNEIGLIFHIDQKKDSFGTNPFSSLQ